MIYPSDAASTSTKPISADVMNAAGAAIASPRGGQKSPVKLARAARGMASATNGPAMMLAGTLVNETVPKIGKRSGRVAT